MSARSKIPAVGVEQRKFVDDALRAIADALPVVTALELCGTDCQEYKRQLEYWSKNLSNLRDQFWPLGK